MSLTDLTLLEAKQKLKSREVTSVELTKSCFDQIRKLDSQVKAFITLNEEAALQRAAEIDAAGAYDTPLAGIPIAAKDLICTKNLRTTAASKILENFVPTYNATVIERLNQAGAVLIGKTNLDEFAMGSSTENSAFFPTSNPWDLTRVPGGSSGGSAAAVAARMCFAALGTDTGGSIRQPASLCGVTGIKPSYGRVSRFGVMAMASSLDQVGVLARNPMDTALVMSVIAGHDPLDSTTLPAEVPTYHEEAQSDLSGMRIGVPKEYFEAGGMAPEDQQVIQTALETIKKLGGELIDISLPHTKYALPVYYLLMASEVSANLARYDGVRFGLSPSEDQIRQLDDIYLLSRSAGFGAEPKRRIMLGTFALSAGYQNKYYLQAQKVRTLIKRDFEQAYERVDAIVTPTSPTTAWEKGEKVNDPFKMYLSDIYTIPANLAGICGLVVPVGLSHSLPGGLQILGPQLGEQVVFNVGEAISREISFQEKPAILG